MDVLRTKNSGIKSFSIEIQVLTDYFLNRTQVTTISNERLKRAGYLFFTDYYLKVTP
jgi:hypothetical protein